MLYFMPKERRSSRERRKEKEYLLYEFESLLSNERRKGLFRSTEGNVASFLFSLKKRIYSVPVMRERKGKFGRWRRREADKYKREREEIMCYSEKKAKLKEKRREGQTTVNLIIIIEAGEGRKRKPEACALRRRGARLQTN